MGIGFRFGLAAVAHGQHVIDQRAAIAINATQNDRKAHLSQQGLHDMLFTDMADFMRQYASNLIGRARLFDEAVEQNDLTTGQRHRIYHVNLGDLHLQVVRIGIERRDQLFQRCVSGRRAAEPAAKIAHKRIAKFLVDAGGDQWCQPLRAQKNDGDRRGAGQGEGDRRFAKAKPVNPATIIAPCGQHSV